ncbi:MAG: START domain-containing protein [Chlorobium sp.]|uniref:START domain-containing protein n=1 Tax=Chlorobium sp. TaxID=1095 RepID=UPI0025C6300D|nr:START domain-containing protein [Chlorobium sp.]MCF8382889.1 START domain-containing protein [Chlorobium sp.]
MDVQSALQANWDFRVEHKGIRIFSSKVKNSDVLGFKGETEFPVTFRKLISLFYDTANYHRWVHQLAGMDVLEKNDCLEYVVRQVINAPWPLQKREMIVRTGLAQAGDHAVAVTMTGEPDYLPPNPQYHRVRHCRGLWIFSPTDSQSVHITFVMHVNPGSDVPSPVSNTAMFEVPFYSLQNMRNLLVSTAYNPPYPEEIEEHLCII